MAGYPTVIVMTIIVSLVSGPFVPVVKLQLLFQV